MYSYISTMHITSDKLQSMAQKFIFLDQNKNGKINYAAEETEKALREILELNDEEVQRL